jgi:hypothetical protein
MDHDADHAECNTRQCDLRRISRPMEQLLSTIGIALAAIVALAAIAGGFCWFTRDPRQ